MCNCLKDVTQKMTDRIKGEMNHAKVYSFEHIGFDNEAMLWGPPIKNAIGLPFTVEYYGKKKDGSRATRRSQYTQKVFMTYCPFCGKKYPNTK